MFYSRSLPRKAIASVIKLGKQRPQTDYEEKQSLKESEQGIAYGNYSKAFDSGGHSCCYRPWLISVFIRSPVQGSMGCLEKHASDVTLAPRPSIDDSASHGQSADEDASSASQTPPLSSRRRVFFRLWLFQYF